jgi:hypothetical protein
MKTCLLKTLPVLALAILLAGCTHEQDPAKTREQAAEAAAKLKQESKEAGKELKKGAEEVGRQGKAIAKGAREGWNSDSTKSQAKPSPARQK